MEMTLAEDYYEGDLDDVAHMLLPREILADVGIVVPAYAAPSSSCAARRRGDDHAAVVEDLAAHLVGILRLDTAREHPRPHWQHVHEQRRRAGMGNGSRASVPVGGGQYHGGAACHAPPASFWNGTTPCPPKFEMAAAMHSHPPARCHGTGVFLPRVEVYEQQNRASSSPNPRNGAKPPQMQRTEAADMAAMRQQQQQLLHLRAMVAEVQRQREAFAAAFQFHACSAIAPSRQWTY
ncbi:unnamed protein product [Alopecurus aequalis]